MQEPNYEDLLYWEYVLYWTKTESRIKNLFVTIWFLDALGTMTCDTITSLTGVPLI